MTMSWPRLAGGTRSDAGAAGLCVPPRERVDERRSLRQNEYRFNQYQTAVLPRPTIEAFDLHLRGLGLRFEGVVIGGSALGLMGVIHRPTRDFDILVPELPPAIASAARTFAKAQRAAGVDIGDDWLNNGPIQLGEILPAGWRERVQRIFDGQALVLTDLPDCIALAPTATELAECLPWLEQQDGHVHWPAHARATVADLARRLGHGV